MTTICSDAAIAAWRWCTESRIPHGFMDGVVLVVHPNTSVAHADKGSPTGKRLLGLYADYDWHLPKGAAEIRQRGNVLRQFVAAR